jgi:GntP family gluconate:H+ symporter
MENEVRSRSAKVLSISDGNTVLLKPARGTSFAEGPYHVFRSDEGRLETVTQVRVQSVDELESGLRIVTDRSDSIEAGDRFVDLRDLRAATKVSKQTVGARIAQGFGATCAKIGILIAMAAIIGKCLLDSGAAECIVFSMRNALGDRKTPLAFAASGFIVGIPVFFDTVFYLLLPLARAMWMRTRENYLLYVLSIVVGATMAHSLVPPTPGPLFVAGELDVNLGLMIIAGSVVGSICVSFGYLYAVWANRRWVIPLRDLAAGEEDATPADRRRPHLLLSLTPIVLPVVLLSAKTLLDMALANYQLPEGVTTALPVVNFLGDKNIALATAAIIALIMLVRFPAPDTNVAQSVQSALLSAGSIILITAAGGAFGQVLRQTGIAPSIEYRFPLAEGGVALLLVAFAITSIVRIAQGSATVAMITSVGIVAPLVANVELAFNSVYVALAIGCGSKPIPWMNDSGFWVVTRMSGMTESEALRTLSVALTIMGFVGLLITLIGAQLLPLV